MRMDPNLTPTTFILSILGVLTLIFIILLPALLELKKPRDAGPRRIMDEAPTNIPPKIVGPTFIVNLEEESGLEQKTVEKIIDVIAVLPNLEV